MQIDSSKTRPIRKVTLKNKEISIPEIGKKRRRNGTTDNEESDDDADSEDLNGPRKQRKVGTGANAKIEEIR